MNNKFLSTPLLSVCLFLGIFVFILFDLSIKLKIILLIAFTVLGFLCATISIKTAKKLLLYLTLVCISGVLSLSATLIGNDLPKISAQEYVGEHEAEGYFTSLHYSSDYSSAHFAKITKIDGKDVDLNTYIVFDELLPENNFKNFKISLEFSKAADFASLNLSQRSFTSKNIYIGAKALSTVSFTGDLAHGILPFFGRLNNAICQRLSYVLSEESAGLVCALLFGNRSLLPETLERDFMTLGITHMLVVSGMNIALIAGEFDLLFSAFTKRKRILSLFSCAICLFYMALCEFSLSVVRAAIMQIIYRIAPNAAREYDSHTSLFIALGIIVLINPGAVFDVGFLLSFFATLGIISFAKFAVPDPSSKVTAASESNTVFSRIKPLVLSNKPLKDLFSSLFASFSACIFVLPITFTVFGTTSLGCAIFTLLFAPFLDVLLYFTPILLVLSFVPVLGEVLALAGEFICNGVYALSGLGIIFKDLYVVIDSAFIFAVAILILSVIFAFLCKSENKVVRLLPSFAVYLIICILLLVIPSKEGMIYYSDNTGEAFMLSTEEGSLMIDVSCGTKSFIGRSRKALSESELKCTNIDTYLITHTSIGHIRAVYTLAVDGYLSQVIMPEPQDNDEQTVFNELFILASKYDFTLETYPNDDTSMTLLGTQIDLHPPLSDSSTGIHKVMYFEIFYNGNKTVYLGQNIADTDFRNFGILEDSTHVVIGSHYPTIKQTFSYRFYPEGIRLFVPEDITGQIFANVDITPYCENSYIRLF